mmetsp:Transcript_64504/g.172015  ORF Transcript_64504/g.172015 Transcript_64504/m.172015 type:complete len:322 (-) Transcript_64504:86-1051(-)
MPIQLSDCSHNEYAEPRADAAASSEASQSGAPAAVDRHRCAESEYDCKDGAALSPSARLHALERKQEFGSELMRRFLREKEQVQSQVARQARELEGLRAENSDLRTLASSLNRTVTALAGDVRELRTELQAMRQQAPCRSEAELRAEVRAELVGEIAAEVGAELRAEMARQLPALTGDTGAAPPVAAPVGGAAAERPQASYPAAESCSHAARRPSAPAAAVASVQHAGGGSAAVSSPAAHAVIGDAAGEDNGWVAELHDRGADWPALWRLAQRPVQQVELSQALKQLGYTKLGQRQRLIQQLLSMAERLPRELPSMEGLLA